jgi:hypothetical protein
LPYVVGQTGGHLFTAADVAAIGIAQAAAQKRERQAMAVKVAAGGSQLCLLALNPQGPQQLCPSLFGELFQLTARGRTGFVVCTSPGTTDTQISVFQVFVGWDLRDSRPSNSLGFFALGLRRQGPAGRPKAAPPAVCKAAPALEVRPRRALPSEAAPRTSGEPFLLSITWLK